MYGHRILASLIALSVGLGAARALAVCPNAQGIAALPGCSNPNGTCTLGSNVDIDNGCTLDFGNRQVFLTARLRIGSGSATILARSFMISSGGLIQGNGNIGGMISIRTTGSFGSSGSGLQIEVVGTTSGGTIDIDAGDDIIIGGRFRADGALGGGCLSLRANDAVTLQATGRLDLSGGMEGSGGDIDVVAAGNLQMLGNVTTSGGDGGAVNLFSGATLTVGNLESVGTGDAGCGGCLELEGHAVEIGGWVRSDGTTGTFESGGSGGFMCIIASFGDVTIHPAGRVSLDGAKPDGSGGLLSVIALGDAEISGPVRALGPPGETCGGGICIETGRSVVVATDIPVDATGGESGGDVDISAGKDLVVRGPLSARGSSQGGFAGSVSVAAGTEGTGNLVVEDTIDVGVNRQCSTELGCGEAGEANLEGCDVRVAPSGRVNADGPDGGDVNVTARRQLSIFGIIDATHSVAEGSDGSILIEHPASRPPTLVPAIAPTPDVRALPDCTRPGQQLPACVAPCPVCGNGIVEFPEACDPTAGPPASCDGCSLNCEIEECNDGRICTTDLCDPQLGCYNELAFTPCMEPTATVTGTPPTATPTITPTQTRTPTETRTPSSTPSASPTPTTTPTPGATQTATHTAVVTPSPTASEASPTVTPAVTSTATSTGAPSATNTPEPTATLPACEGDCDANREVAVHELITGVDIALGSAAIESCPRIDSNRDAVVTIDELVRAVARALVGCPDGAQ